MRRRIAVFFLFCISAVTLGEQEISAAELALVYECNPPCGPNECCVHQWYPDGTLLGKRLPRIRFWTNFSGKRNLQKTCQPDKMEGERCLVQKTLEQCPCGRGLYCRPDNNEFGLYFGKCSH